MSFAFPVLNSGTNDAIMRNLSANKFRFYINFINERAGSGRFSIYSGKVALHCGVKFWTEENSDFILITFTCTLLTFICFFFFTLCLFIFFNTIFSLLWNIPWSTNSVSIKFPVNETFRTSLLIPTKSSDFEEKSKMDQSLTLGILLLSAQEFRKFSSLTY